MLRFRRSTLKAVLGAAFVGTAFAVAPAWAVPGDPVPDPTAQQDFAYFGYLEDNGVSVPDRYLAQALGIGICNALNRDTMSIDAIVRSLRGDADPHKAWVQMTGAAIHYCPWNLDRVQSS